MTCIEQEGRRKCLNIQLWFVPKANPTNPFIKHNEPRGKDKDFFFAPNLRGKPQSVCVELIWVSGIYSDYKISDYRSYLRRNLQFHSPCSVRRQKSCGLTGGFSGICVYVSSNTNIFLPTGMVIPFCCHKLFCCRGQKKKWFDAVTGGFCGFMVS